MIFLWVESMFTAELHHVYSSMNVIQYREVRSRRVSTLVVGVSHIQKLTLFSVALVGAPRILHEPPSPIGTSSGDCRRLKFSSNIHSIDL